MTGPRSAVVVALLILGIAWSLPTQTDQRGSGIASTAVSVAPDFELRVQRGSLYIGGHTLSADHERRLRATAARHFPTFALETRFVPFGLVPRWWEAATLELLTTLPATLSPHARLHSDSLRVEALAYDVAAAKLRLAALREALPDKVELSLHVAGAGPDIDARRLCARAYEGFTHKRIRFEESGTAMLTSAYPVLDRVAVLADACRDARIMIVGHTDSSGVETQNQALSLARARAVADWLEGRGIDATRMEARGAGSSVPVADNATRYGRSLNRRIEIRLRPSGETTPAPSG
jgi:outer membrane protein OmpA-like peptidoglycan-associated protein